MTPGFIRITINGLIDAEELVGDLASTGILGASESDGAVQLYWSEESWDPAIPETVRNLLSLRGTSDVGGTITEEQVPDQDWNALWSRSVTPVRIGRRFLIRQSWNPVDVPPGIIELVIDPKRAFGTGFHATTQLLLEWLEDTVSGGERVLDVGTGSGILAMAALRLSAAHAVGIDSDPEAIGCAHENAAVNGFGAELDLRAANAEQGITGQFDLVLANLDRNALLRSAAMLTSAVKPEGRLLICGIQDQDSAEIAHVFEAAGCHVSARRQKEEWAGLEIRRKGTNRR